jgi:hypothetical protein
MTGVCFKNQKYPKFSQIINNKIAEMVVFSQTGEKRKKKNRRGNEKLQTKEETGKPHNMTQTGSRLEIRWYQETSFAFCHWQQQQQQPCASSAPKAFHSRLRRSKCEDDLRNDCHKSKLLRSRNPLEIRCPKSLLNSTSKMQPTQTFFTPSFSRATASLSPVPQLRPEPT